MGTIQVRIDDELKRKSDNLFHDLGTDTTTAIRMFLTQAVAHNGFPFEIKKSAAHDSFTPMTEEQLLNKLEQARQHAADGTVKTGEEVLADMRLKYGL
ncbi:MAG: type II toxin-antitoxin system RelB/DinJ family antitoxin [Anaerovoracaceae bacterium]